MEYVRVWADEAGVSHFEDVAVDGERREFDPGAIVLAEDTEGEGHVSTPLTDDLRFVMIPTG